MPEWLSKQMHVASPQWLGRFLPVFTKSVLRFQERIVSETAQNTVGDIQIEKLNFVVYDKSTAVASDKESTADEQTELDEFIPECNYDLITTKIA